MLVTLKNKLTDEKIIFNVDTIDTTKIMNALSKWIEMNLDKFNLNEMFSCDVTIEGLDILISGDEDRVRLTVSVTESEAIELKCQ